MFFTAHVVENRPLGRGSFVLRLGGCEALAGAQPGQFVMLRGEWGRDPLLPRAFSILRTVADGGCEILVKAVGRGTRLLEHAASGARLTVLGPLGQRFPAPEAGRRDLLVAGGVGLAPLLWHAEVARAAGFATDLFYGARTAADLVLLDEVERAGCRVHLTTEDGSRGTHGRVTAALAARLAEGVPGPPPKDGGAAGPQSVARILTCGPNPMMRAVVELARAGAIDCVVSVEGEMACGVGACLGCALPCTTGERPFLYACVDGPVFDAARVIIP
jgi:dihydroorotate dehydrogenase electron transfer subunit